LGNVTLTVEVRCNNGVSVIGFVQQIK